MSRQQLDGFLEVAQCCIVASTPGEVFDAYVLSESSLFVYADKLVIKTCGTTALLKALPTALELAAGVGAPLVRARYSRACFKYPAVQPAPHRSWGEECAFLDAALGARGTARVLGDGSGLKWHLYCADLLQQQAPGSDGQVEAPATPKAVQPGSVPTFTLEICMTQLDPSATAAFTFGDGQPLPPAAEVTASSGITSLFPADMVIDDFVFSPCGYSMNGVLGPGLATIHVTPEARCSYASVEVSGHAQGVFNPRQLVAAACAVFKPGAVCVALTVDGRGPVPAEWAAITMPDQFLAPAAVDLASMPAGGFVLHTNSAVAPPPKAPAPKAPAAKSNKKRTAVSMPPSCMALLPAPLEVM